MKELTPTGERADGRSGLIVNENGRVPQAHKAIGYYESIFYAFYNKDIDIDDSDMSAALSDCYQLLSISDYLGCTSLISKPIEVAVLKHGQELHERLDRVPRRTEIGLADPPVAVLHETGERRIRDENVGRVT